jgi:hypothetical protein
VAASDFVGRQHGPQVGDLLLVAGHLDGLGLAVGLERVGVLQGLVADLFGLAGLVAAHLDAVQQGVDRLGLGEFRLAEEFARHRKLVLRHVVIPLTSRNEDRHFFRGAGVRPGECDE